jgi:hypothetical protein
MDELAVGWWGESLPATRRLRSGLVEDPEVGGGKLVVSAWALMGVPSVALPGLEAGSAGGVPRAYALGY